LRGQLALWEIANLSDLASLQLVKNLQHSRHEWLEIFETVAPRPEHQNRKWSLIEPLLPRHVCIDRDENIATVRQRIQQWAVVLTIQFQATCRLDVIVGKVPSKRARNASVEHDPHRRLTPPARHP
jgi:hypothetical protein